MWRDAFIEGRRSRWERLDVLVTHAGHNLRSMAGSEILEMGRLYRATTADLATARRDFPDDSLTLYLNGLVARAHPVIYQGGPSGLQQLTIFIRYGFPATFRETAPYTACAFGLFAVSAIIAAILVAIQPRLADVLLPGQAGALRAVMTQHHLWMKSATSDHSVAANFIMLNNIKVALLAAAGGILVDIGSLVVLLQNGVMLGAVATMVAQYHLSLPFWAFVLPHGVIELSVIFIAGGAGLMVGDAVLRPGLISRGEAITNAARQAAMLLFGCIPLLMIAGTIEAFFSPSDAPPALKFVVALIAGTLLYSYLLMSRPAEMRNESGFDESIRESLTVESVP